MARRKKLPPSAKSATTTPDERVLAYLRGMVETALQLDVVEPLLRKLGMQDVTYTHGPGERGKDFLFVVPADAFEDERFAACVVKNEKLHGNSAVSGAATSALEQLIQCRRFEALNPSSNRKERPTDVYFVSTYPLPDAALADAAHLLEEIRENNVHVIGPDKLVRLIKKKLPELYNEQAFPGEGIREWFAKTLNTHSEAHVLGTRRNRPLDLFFVDLSLTLPNTCLHELMSGRLRVAIPSTTPWTSLPFTRLQQVTVAFDTISARTAEDYLYYDARSDSTRSGEKPLTLKKLKELIRVKKTGHEALAVRVDLSRLLSDVERYLESLPRMAESDRIQAGCTTAEAAFELGYLLDNLPSEIRDKHLTSESDSESSAGFSLPSIPSSSLAHLSEHTCVIGEAGAGKTSLVLRVRFAGT